jgi:hypothetical protein
MSSEVIRRSSEGHQSASRGTPEALQRYSKVYQKTPVFLLKYCHNKDLKKIELRISVKNPKSEYLNPKQIRMAEILMTKTKLLKWLTPLRQWGIESPIIGRRCAFGLKKKSVREDGEGVEKR